MTIIIHTLVILPILLNVKNDAFANKKLKNWIPLIPGYSFYTYLNGHHIYIEQFKKVINQIKVNFINSPILLLMTIYFTITPVNFKFAPIKYYRGPEINLNIIHLEKT